MDSDCGIGGTLKNPSKVGRNDVVRLVNITAPNKNIAKCFLADQFGWGIFITSTQVPAYPNDLRSIPARTSKLSAAYGSTTSDSNPCAPTELYTEDAMPAEHRLVAGSS